jgi:nucleoside-diphosphate-sugar epimerase
MSRPVLVTGACGLLGAHVVRRLAAAGTSVVALDLRNPTTAAVARSLESAGDVRIVYADITDPDAIGAALRAANPRAVIHLAAVIPPGAYLRPALAYRVNVEGTANVVAALESCTDPGRLVLASSTATYGSRNAAKELGLCTAATPVNPCDVYGHHKVLAEQLVRASSLQWAILRIGGIIAADLVRRVDRNSILMDAIIPTDNRIHSVSVIETAEAFANAADADCIAMTLLIAGDESHMLRQSQFASHMMEIAGLGSGARSRGRRGNPADDDAWFLTDWMDTTQARAVLGFRAVPMAECVASCRGELSGLRALLRPFGPVAPLGLSLLSPYRRMPGRWADPWSVIAKTYGSQALVPAG